VSANIDRIREIRNTYCGHAPRVSLSDTEFRNVWGDLTTIIGELEASLPGGSTLYTDAANYIKTATMDPKQEQDYLEKIDEQHLSIEDLKGTILLSFLKVLRKISMSKNCFTITVIMMITWLSFEI
jgi:hypothetical protein